MAGLTLDTGALIALERGDTRMSKVFARAAECALTLTVPMVVVAEWWRGSSRRVAWILDSCDLEAMDEALAKAAGEALQAIGRATTIDAIVMASAARRGDLVYTSDFDDLTRLAAHFPSVRVLSVDEPPPSTSRKPPARGRPRR